VAKAMRKVRTGSVIRTKQDKTAIVEMIWKQRHRLYRKQVRRVARFYVHDPENQCRLGDVVRIEETRPISKTKHWRLLEVLERRQVADVRPIELESDVQSALTTSESPEIASNAELDGEVVSAQDGNETLIADDSVEESSGNPEMEESEEERE